MKNLKWICLFLSLIISDSIAQKKYDEVYEDYQGYIDEDFLKFTGLSNSYFKKGIALDDIEYSDDIYIYDTKIDKKFIINTTSLSGIVDLRFIDFSEVDTVIIDNFSFIPGKLLLLWEQLSDKIIPNPDLPLDDALIKLDYTLKQLSNNYLILNDKNSADAVLYELESLKYKYNRNIKTIFYRTLFGYGYKPLRFVIFLILPIILIFAWLYYLFFYGSVALILNPNILQDNFNTFHDTPLAYWKDNMKVEFVLLKKTISFFNHKNINRYGDERRVQHHLGRLTKFWQVIFFSFSVLLGLRFKKEWINHVTTPINSKHFIKLVTLQYVLGYILIFMFISGYKGSIFLRYKDMLQF